MLHFHHKLPTGAAVILLAVLLHGCGVQAASLPRHFRLRGGDGDQGQPAGSDLLKALEYIENLKQRNGGRPGPAPSDYDEVDKFRVLLQLASQQQRQKQEEEKEEEEDEAPAERQDVTAEQLMRSLLRSLQDQAKLSPASTPRNDRRLHRHRTKGAETVQSSPAEYANYPRPHKKYPLMFEDEENTDASKRATEDLDQKYTPQSLANLRSIFEELERMPIMSAGQQKRDVFGDEDEEGEDDDAAPGEEWVPVEEREETEEMVNGSHEEADRALGDQEDEDGEEVQRRSGQDQEDANGDDTKLVDYYLLKVLEMSDQTQKREQTGEQRKRLIRPSIVDPRKLKELLELSLKLHVPPQDLIDMLLTEELRKLHRNPLPPSSRYTTGQTPKVRYFSRRLPVKSKAAAPEDMDREDFLDIIGVETISNEYPVMPRPIKTSSDRIPAGSNPDPNAGSVKIPPPAGRRENLFLSELNKMPFRRQVDDGDDDGDDGDVEDEVTTYLAAKILTEYPPDGIAKRDTQAQTKGRFPYELYERAVKDYLGQADSGSRPVAKREAEEEKPTEVRSKEEEEEEGMRAKTFAPVAGATSRGEEGEEPRDKAVAGM